MSREKVLSCHFAEIFSLNDLLLCRRKKEQKEFFLYYDYGAGDERKGIRSAFSHSVMFKYYKERNFFMVIQDENLH